MATIRLKSPSADKLAAALFQQIADGFKGYVDEQLKDRDVPKDAPKFYWRGRNPVKGRKIFSINDIPVAGITPLPSGIGVVTKGDNIAHLVAQRFYEHFRREAPVRTGRYASSVNFLLGRRIRALSTIVKFGEGDGLYPGETVRIYSDAIYATKLEADYYRRDRQGIWRKITRKLIAEFGSRASIKYTTTSGRNLNTGFDLATPVIVIGEPGAFASGINSRTGQSAQRKARAAKRKAARP